MNAERCADLAVAHALLEHSDDVSTKLFFIGISQMTFGGLWNRNIEPVDMPS